jgi:signal transduction histidine kinase
LVDTPAAVIEQIVSQAMKLIVWVTVPGILIFAAVEVALGRATPMLAAYAGSQLLLVVAYIATRRSSFRLRAASVAVYILFVVLLSFLHYGPAIGTGIVIVGAAIWAGIIFRTLGAVVISITVVALMVLVAVGTTQGWLPPARLASQDVRSAANWVRFTVTVTLCTAGLGWLVMRVIGALESSVLRAREVFFERELERDRRDKTERELERAQRLDALGRLAGGVGHDINNALSVVLFNAEALSKTKSSDRRELAEEIISAVLTARETTL